MWICGANGKAKVLFVVVSVRHYEGLQDYEDFCLGCSGVVPEACGRGH